MPKFAVIEEEKVINIIVAETQEDAEQVTGKMCVEFTNELIESGATLYVDGKFETPGLKIDIIEIV